MPADLLSAGGCRPGDPPGSRPGGFVAVHGQQIAHLREFHHWAETHWFTDSHLMALTAFEDGQVLIFFEDTHHLDLNRAS